jgi:hypothetical protein
MIPGFNNVILPFDLSEENTFKGCEILSSSIIASLTLLLIASLIQSVKSLIIKIILPTLPLTRSASTASVNAAGSYALNQRNYDPNSNLHQPVQALALRGQGGRK